MKLFRKWVALCMTIMLLIPFQLIAYADGGGGVSVDENQPMRIQNKWKNNFLYEDSSGVVRYGFPSRDDQSAQWYIKNAPGGNGNKQIVNRATGHAISMANITKRKDMLTAVDISGGSTTAVQWMIQTATRAGYVTMKSATTPSLNNFIHQEDQLGFAEVSSDINPAFESPQWRFEPVTQDVLVLIENKFRTDQYLYEALPDKDDGDRIKVAFGKKAANDPTAQWYMEVVTDQGNGTQKVRLKNRASGRYISHDVDRAWAAIETQPMANTTANQWTIAPGTSDGWVTITSVLDSGNWLNTQFETDIFARSNNWPGTNTNANSQWKIELAADVPAVRIANYTTENVSDKYLYEDQGIVKYTSLNNTVSSAVYKWIVEDFDGKKRFRNLGTGNYMTSAGDHLSASAVAALAGNQSSGGNDRWAVKASNIYDDYVTVQSAVYSNEYLNVQDELQFAQSMVINPDSNPAQWVFEDPSFVAGVDQYVRIQSEWQSLFLYEDENGELKYGNVKANDQHGQWLVEKFNGRKRIKNRATGHYINMHDMSNGHLKVSDVDNSWTDAVWVIESLDGGSKLIHSVNDSNSDENHQKYINLQNLNKYAEYNEINRGWGSPRWRFQPVVDGAAFYLIQSKLNGKYFYEEDGKVKYGDIDSLDPIAHWAVEDQGGWAYLHNRSTGHYIAMEGIDPAANLPVALPSMEIYSTWASPKWTVEDGPDSGYKTIKSAWTGEHYINVKDSIDYAQSNKNIPVEDKDAMEFKFTTAPDLPVELPTGNVRIKNPANGQYLYEARNGVVMYGTPAQTDGYSQWVIQDSNGAKQIKNVASGHYVKLDVNYQYVESAPLSNDAAASEWTVDATPSGTTFFIRSNKEGYKDEYLNVQNSLGYAERGLYPDSQNTMQWVLEPVTGNYTTTLPAEPDRNLKTSTPAFDDTNYIRIKNKVSGEYLLADGTTVKSGSAAPSELASQWLLQDFNGRKLLKNRLNGQLLSTDGSADGLSTALEAKATSANNQWVVEDYLGYERIKNAANSQAYVYGAAKQGVITSQLEDSLWTFEAQPADAVYEAEQAFIGGGVQIAPAAIGATGSGYLNHFASTGARAVLAVTSQDAGTYAATVHYANPTGATKTISVFVNGLPVQQLSLAATSSGTWANADVSLPLRAGYNSVSLEMTGADTGGINFDNLTVHNIVNKSYRGATATYTTYELEQANTNGTLIGPNRVYHEVANEASGRQAVKLDQTGQYVQFTTAKDANSLVLRYSIPDAPEGNGINATLGLYVNDVKVKDLELTSHYAWEYGNYPWSKDPAQGSAHRFFDEIHTMIGNVPAGATIKLQKDGGNTADYYIVDLVDLESAPTAAYTMPAGYLSVTDYGAVADDNNDDTQAFKDAVTAAKAQNKGVWFPAGSFELDNGGDVLVLDDVMIRGAGMWYTTLNKAKFYGLGNNIRVYDLAIDGNLNIRDDEAHTNGFEGAFGPGSTVQSVWIEHTKTGMWIARPAADSGFDSSKYTNEFYVGGLRIRNTMADGMNFSSNTKNSMVEQTNVRYPGDDGLAMWSRLNEGFESDFTYNNTFRFNTVQLPWLANNMILFGGKDNKMQDNVLVDTIGLGSGITVSTRFSPLSAFDGTTLVERNTLIRTGSRDAGLNINFGAIEVYADTKAIDSPIIIRNNIALDSTYAGIAVQGTMGVNQVKLENIVSDGSGLSGLEVSSGVSGKVDVNNVIIRNAKMADIANNAGANLKLNEVGRGFASTNFPKDSFPGNGGAGGGGAVETPAPSGTPAPTTKPAPTVVKVDKNIITNAAANKEQKIVINTNTTNGPAKVQLNLADLSSAVSSIPNAQVVIQHQNASYTLPVDLSKIIGGDTKNGVLSVTIDKVDSTQADEINSKASDRSLKMLDTPVSFEVSLESGDKSIEIKRFGSNFVTRTITIDGNVDSNTATAVVYDPATGEFRYVPAVFSSENGQTTVTINSTTNSIYAVAQSSKSFSDVSAHWAKKDIELLASKLVVNGKTDDQFAPEDHVTRAEFAALLVRSLGLTKDADASQMFTDVKAGDWFYDSVQAAAQYKLIEGFDDQSFKPQQTITREQMAVMIARALQLRSQLVASADSSATASFKDASAISSWSSAAFDQVIANGIMQGVDNDRLAPQDLATRAQSVVILSRMLQAMQLIN
ncbi:S-layer homology domain-containing protein [Paenibacillus athensensis]|uniref:S-layer homology domain-containing protein n=1 Tax=Paenibacillus athensensis TaxID=1967502 RepID=A0A4Y8Q6H7_9BACL|nr:S-layer homology domain-containing protein [Paenibacillus athensensis]MCD1259492.1 S-layer homology domain-containing protein [Paenibacillus athensensis]